MLALHLLEYRLFSITGLFILLQIFSFPFAVFMNLSFGISVRADLWPETHYAMYACALAIPFFALGCRMARTAVEKNVAGNELSTRGASILAWSLIIPSVLILFSAGVYYHGSEAEYNWDSIWMLNAVSYMVMTAYVGVLLQLRRYLKTHSSSDLLLFLLLALGVMLAFLPSGGRLYVIQFLPFVGAYYLSEYPDVRIRQIFFLAGTAFLVFLVVAVVGVNRGKYRDADISTRLDAYIETTQELGEQREEVRETVTGRFSDYAPVGRIVAVFPEVFPYRFFEDMDLWWQIILPGFVRKEMGADAFNFNESTLVTERIGVTGESGGSTGTTLIGDLYSRFGWFGMIISMFIIGFLIQKIENRFLDKTIFGTIFFMIGGLRFMILGSLFKVFLALTKDLVILLIVCYILSKILPREQVAE